MKAKHDRDLLKKAEENLSKDILNEIIIEASEECQHETAKAIVNEIIVKGLMTDEELKKIVSPEELKQVKREAVSEYRKQWK